MSQKGFVYSQFVRSREARSQPLSEREIILQALIDDETPQKPRESLRLLRRLREYLAQMAARPEQSPEME